MKKLIALLMALLMVATMMTTAMAYDATKKPSTPTLKHTLNLTDLDLTGLPYDIEYSFTVTEGPKVAEPKIVKDATKLVEGTPIFGNIKYTAGVDFDDQSKSCTKDLTIDWENVVIKEPGVYYWVINKQQINKQFEELPKDQQPSNNNTTLYLYVYATVAGSEGAATTLDFTVNLYKEQPTTETAKNETLTDQYPSSLLTLAIEKQVIGNQGSHSQYFPISVTLIAPTSDVDQVYTITGVDKTIQANAYDDQTRTNRESVTVAAGNTTASFVLWLKHGQKAVIDGLLYDTQYVITENPKDLNNDTTDDGDTNPYKATVKISAGDTDAKTGTADSGVATAQDGGLTVNGTTVTFTNAKSTPVPTGIDLQTSAPIFGLLMAMAMMFMAFAGKRKEQMN